MHKQFVKYFVDPYTHEPLSLEITSASGDMIESGILRNNSTGKGFPIERGIPRFVDYEKGNYAKSFCYQWKKWSTVQFDSENIGKPMEGYTQRMWERIVRFKERSLKVTGVTIADIGCGPGRFIESARSRGAKVIGIEYSDAVEVARINFLQDPDVCICQGDALHLPLATESLDGAFSIGVLHHTPDPARGVEEAYRVIKTDAWFALSVYAKGGYYDFPTVVFWRGVFKSLWPFFMHYPPLLYSYFTNLAFRPIAVAFPLLGKAIGVVFPFVKLPDFNWSLLDTFDSITPSYQSAHESQEVIAWLRKCGFRDIEASDWSSTSFSAIKSLSAW